MYIHSTLGIASVTNNHAQIQNWNKTTIRVGWAAPNMDMTLCFMLAKVSCFLLQPENVFLISNVNNLYLS